jgi:outer membrane protein OmpA-like peptidoglycan-associated protein
MVRIGNMSGKRFSALITDMDQPLGNYVGNALEVEEAIEVLSGRAEGPLKVVSLVLGAHILKNAGVVDTDKAGIADFKDKCPGTPAGHAVDSTGCLPDFDKDGVADIIDKCPNTLPGVRVDGEGCPINKKEDLDQLKKGIQFKTGSAKLTKNSYSTLNDIADLMNKIPEANLEVQGHTDNKGSDAKNQKLSESRAQAVVTYLQKRGVNSDRLRAVGYGPSKPIADNGDAAGRAQNRRVELVPFAK